MQQDFKKSKLIGHGSFIERARTLIQQVAQTSAPVLILGESGTGKEIAAHSIHQQSERSKESFITVNCAAIPHDLLESELFGYEKGAFTGATQSKPGWFELADGGSIFLDEIGDMPIDMQAKLLRILQEHRITRIGGHQHKKIDIRVIAATNHDLQQEVSEGRFRKDLYYRLNVFPIQMPSLKERQEDIPALIERFIEQASSEAHPAIQLTEDAIQLLSSHTWPGNVRELKNLIQRLTILYPAALVDAKDIPVLQQTIDEEVIDEDIFEQAKESATGFPLKDYLQHIEARYIIRALEEHRWIVAKTADFLHMHRTTLIEKMRKYGLKRPSKQSVSSC